MSWRNINMTPYTVIINSFFLGTKGRIQIPSSGVITFMAVSSPAAFGDLSVWEPETFVLSGVPEKLDDEAVYIVTPGVEEALRAAGYDMSRFCTADSISPELSDEPAASLSCSALNPLPQEDSSAA